MALYQEIRNTVARLRNTVEKYAIRSIETKTPPPKVKKARWEIVATAAHAAIVITLEPINPEKDDVSKRTNSEE